VELRIQANCAIRYSSNANLKFHVKVYVAATLVGTFMLQDHLMVSHYNYAWKRKDKCQKLLENFQLACTYTWNKKNTDTKIISRSVLDLSTLQKFLGSRKAKERCTYKENAEEVEWFSVLLSFFSWFSNFP
jgi:hypothetical protein